MSVEHEYLKHIGYKYDEQSSTFSMGGSFDLQFDYNGGGRCDYYSYVGSNSRFGGLHSFENIIDIMASLGFVVSMESFKLFKRSETIKKILNS